MTTKQNEQIPTSHTRAHISRAPLEKTMQQKINEFAVRVEEQIAQNRAQLAALPDYPDRGKSVVRIQEMMNAGALEQ